MYLDIGLETDGRLPEDILEVAGPLLGHELEVLVLRLAGELVRELGGLGHLLRKPRSVEQLVTGNRISVDNFAILRFQIKEWKCDTKTIDKIKEPR